jgi:GNAT superfamily N-acetyltransferase
MRRIDIPAVVDLRRRLWPDDVSTPASYAWGMEHGDPAERVRRWVATANGRVVGFAVAARAAWTTGRVAVMYFGVEPAMRGRGIGGRLYDAARAHVARLRPTRTMTATERGDDASIRFLAARGFHHTRDDQAWSVDPRTVRFDDLSARRAAAEAAGLLLVPVRLLLDRPEDLYRLHLALEHDLPTDTPIAEAYPSWRTHELETPLFAPDASFCVLADGDPIALTWIMLDGPGQRASHGMTGTLPAFRHRGLARLVKLASIAWLAAHGVTVLYTANDTENHDMLALNADLGFRPLTVFELWARDS